MTSFQDFKREEIKDIVKPMANLAGSNCDRLDNADDTKLIILLTSATVRQQEADWSKKMNGPRKRAGRRRGDVLQMPGCGKSFTPNLIVVLKAAARMNPATVM